MRSRPVPCTTPWSALRREATQRTSHIALTKALERAIAELANALAGDAEHGPDLLQGVLPSAVQPEIEPQHFRVAHGQSIQRLLDFIGEEAIHRFLLRVRQLVRD